MLRIFKCRRSSIALIGMVIIAAMGIHLNIDTSGAVAMICMAIAAANASEGVATKVKGKKED